MSHTLVAVFETNTDADRAKEELIKAGYDRGSVQLHDAASSSVQSSGAPTDGDDSIFSGIKHMFNNLLGRENGDHHAYAEAVKRGHAVLTILTPTREEADRAADIIEAYGPLDLDDQQSHWRAGGWTGGADYAGASLYQGQGGTPQGSLGAQQSDPAQRGVQQPAQLNPQETAQPVQSDLSRSQQGMSQQAQGSMQRAAAGAQTPLGSGDPLSTGQRVTQRGASLIYPRDEPQAPNQATLDILSGSGEDNDDYFRSHWESTLSYTGGTYQEFDPAYRYGSSMAGSSAYRDLPWEEAEPELRTTWEHTYPQSSWDKFKDAVREGWDRMTK